MAYLITGLYLSYLASNYNVMLDIDKINLMEVISRESSLNKGLRYSHLEGKISDPIIIMGHSGLGDNALFNDLILLENGDLISLHYLDDTKIYKVTDKIFFKKFQSINIKKSGEYLYLVTCDLHDYSKQWLIEAKIHEEG